MVHILGAINIIFSPFVKSFNSFLRKLLGIDSFYSYLVSVKKIFKKSDGMEESEKDKLYNERVGS